MVGDKGVPEIKSPYIHAKPAPKSTNEQKVRAEIARRAQHYGLAVPVQGWNRQGVPTVPYFPGHQKGVGPERASEVLLGKSLTNLIAHGHTSDPWGAALEAGMFFPPFRFGRAGRAAAKAVEEAPATAKAVEDVVSPTAQVSQSLKGAASVRGRQEALRSTELSARVGKASQALGEAGGGIAGHEAALGQLKGELPKLNFKGFTKLTPDALDALARHIDEHPTLRFFEKRRAIIALDRATSGKVPTASEQRLLETVFGKANARAIAGPAGVWKNLPFEVWNIPRSLMASGDLSGTLRQALVAFVRHPVITGRNIPPQMRAFASEKFYTSMMDAVKATPTYGLKQQAGLDITDLEHAGDLANREEQFAFSNLAEKLTGGKKYSFVRMSGRAYTGFLVKTRSDIFDHLIAQAQKQGVNVNDDRFLTSLGTVINSATGRGTAPRLLQSHLTTLNALLFSPRLLFSRLNFLSPVWYLRLDPFARKEALKSALALAGTMTVVLELAKLAGAQVGTDPRNADFAKIRLGKTRIDVAGGFQQPIRLLSQLESGKIISSTTGKTLTLGPQGPGKMSKRDIIQRFAEGKLNPSVSLINDWFKGTDFQGQPFSWKKEMVQRMYPLLAQDAKDLYSTPPAGLSPWEAAIGGYGLGAFGVGLQTYGPKSKKSGVIAPPSYTGAGDSGGGPSYTGGSSDSGGASYVR